MRALGRFAVAGLLAAAGCTGVATGLAGRPSAEEGVLRGKFPVASHGVTHIDRLTDGIAANPDDPRQTDLTSVFRTGDAFATFDLGAAVPIACVALDAAGDAAFAISLSGDGRAWQPLWTAAPTGEHGIEPRAVRGLTGSGRYLRVSAAGGEAPSAVAELAAASACPLRWPPPTALQAGTPIEESASWKAWALAASAAVFILAYRRRSPDFIKLLVAVPIGLATALTVQLADVWPPSGALGLVLGAVVAIVGGAAGLRFAISRRRAARRRRAF
jgi:hypothetical protein